MSQLLFYLLMAFVALAPFAVLLLIGLLEAGHLSLSRRRVGRLVGVS